MEATANDELYVDWMSKWRLWKRAWCESDEQVVQFYLKFISKGRKYNPVDHADLAAGVSKAIGPSNIDKNGTIEVRNGAVVLPTISTTIGQDRFGIVTLKLCFFSRPEILKVALVLEDLGHGVVHDNGRVVSSMYPNDESGPRKMPWRDDPTWSIIAGSTDSSPHKI